MNATNKLLDKYREVCSITSDNALGVSLGVKRQAVHQWRKGSSWPTDGHVMAMTKAIEAEPAGWLAAIQAEKAGSEAARKAWTKAAKQLGWAAAITLLIGAGGNTAQAGTMPVSVPITGHNVYYVK